MKFISILIFAIYTTICTSQTLNFDSFESLPSEQGWSIAGIGINAGMFTTNNGIMYENGIGLGDIAGLFYLPLGSIVNPTESWSVFIRGRVLEDEIGNESGFGCP